MLPSVPMTQTEDQADFLASLRAVAVGLLLEGEKQGEWQIVDTRPTAGPRGEARFASFTIQSRDFVKRDRFSVPVRVLFRGTATGSRQSVQVTGYQLIPHPYYVSGNPDPTAPQVVYQYEE